MKFTNKTKEELWAINCPVCGRVLIEYDPKLTRQTREVFSITCLECDVAFVSELPYLKRVK